MSDNLDGSLPQNYKNISIRARIEFVFLKKYFATALCGI